MVDVFVRCASLQYNFTTASWEAVASWDGLCHGSGTTPEEAVENMRHECNKHDLWPKES